MNAIRVALVEDHPQFLAEIQDLLAVAPQLEVVGSYTTGEEALAGILRSQPEVALVDLGLPKLSGTEVIRQISQQRCPTECLVLTAYDDDAHLLAALEAGAVGYIVKDRATAAEIVAAIAEVRQGGAPMSFGLARRVLEALRAREAQPPASSVQVLSVREREVLEARARGLTSRQVAATLHISYETVRQHHKLIYEKLHVHSIAAAVAAMGGRKPKT
jgi:DNA-binding NarL/FixJ family response regulator